MLTKGVATGLDKEDVRKADAFQYRKQVQFRRGGPKCPRGLRSRSPLAQPHFFPFPSAASHFRTLAFLANPHNTAPRLLTPEAMAGSRFAYVRSFELPDPVLPGVFMVVRIDGKGFHG
jgi:hypothetical protein